MYMYIYIYICRIDKYVSVRVCKHVRVHKHVGVRKHVRVRKHLRARTGASALAPEPRCSFLYMSKNRRNMT